MEETLTVTQHFKNQQLHQKGPSSACMHPKRNLNKYVIHIHKQLSIFIVIYKSVTMA